MKMNINIGTEMDTDKDADTDMKRDTDKTRTWTLLHHCYLIVKPPPTAPTQFHSETIHTVRHWLYDRIRYRRLV